MDRTAVEAIGDLVLHPAVKAQVEKTVEQYDNVIEFIRKDLGARHFDRYHGETAGHTTFGTHDWMVAPSPCVVCDRIVLGEGLGFWDKFTAEWHPLCLSCHGRWWIDPPVPA